MIEFENVTKVYPNGTLALDGVNLKINDGEFEMLFIRKPHSIIGYIKTIFAILFRRHNNKKYFEYYQTEKIKIKSEEGIPWTIDGEFGGRKKEVEINNINMAIEYVIPM